MNEKMMGSITENTIKNDHIILEDAPLASFNSN
jgi:hypothetical protein